MNEQAFSLWRHLLEKSSGVARGVSKVDAQEVCNELNFQPGELGPCIESLCAIDAVSFLSDEEVAQIASGRSVSGRLVTLNTASDVFFLRVEDPADVELRLTALGQLLTTRIRALGSNIAPTPAAEIATQIGISAQQLEEGASLPLSDDHWRMYSTMSLDFFVTAWQRMEAEGNATAIIRLQAALGRLHRQQIESVDNLQLQHERIQSTIGLIQRRRRDSNANVGPRFERLPIPEPVRHEVWRRDQGRCVQCGSQERLEFDHVYPLSEGGSNTARNIQVLCESCNRRKGARI